MLDSTKGSTRPVLPSVVDPDGCVLLETRIGHFDRASEQKGREKGMSRDMHISAGTLIVLCEMAGAGKSTFARQHFQPTQVVSSDPCRALICDSERNPLVDPDTFVIFHFIVHKQPNLVLPPMTTSTALHDYP